MDPEEAQFLDIDLVKGSCLIGSDAEIVEQIGILEEKGLNQIILYPPLNRQYRMIEDFADRIMVHFWSFAEEIAEGSPEERRIEGMLSDNDNAGPDVYASSSLPSSTLMLNKILDSLVSCDIFVFS